MEANYPFAIKKQRGPSKIPANTSVIQSCGLQLTCFASGNDYSLGDVGRKICRNLENNKFNPLCNALIGESDEHQMNRENQEKIKRIKNQEKTTTNPDKDYSQDLTEKIRKKQQQSQSSRTLLSRIQ